MSDEFAKLTTGLESPTYDYFSITTSDSVDFDSVTRGIYVGGDGDIVCINRDGDAVTFVGVLAGSILPIRASRVNATSTTATNLVGLV